MSAVGRKPRGCFGGVARQALGVVKAPSRAVGKLGGETAALLFLLLCFVAAQFFLHFLKKTIDKGRKSVILITSREIVVLKSASVLVLSHLW